MRIALDAMGGERAPQQIVRGAVEACRHGSGEVVLVGTMDCVLLLGYWAVIFCDCGACFEPVFAFQQLSGLSSEK
ncbi:hypothetical protein LCGC14_1505950 [marine sediment metagenome]|uniref:Phosphate acyltransferase n=1 Tax=marine sediment metagenome TaxID=412755 RepID=A0A0F9M433_9ZZZZ